MSAPDAELDRRAKVARHAHHEAGHAVAAVTVGATITDIQLANVDWDYPGNSMGVGKVTYRHPDRYVSDHAFITFAGPWAAARWSVEHDPDVDGDLTAAEVVAWWDAEDGDADAYAKFADDDKYETAWAELLEARWPAICAVAELLIDGQTVEDDNVEAIVGRTQGGN